MSMITSKKTQGLWYTAADEPGEFVNAPYGQERCNVDEYALTLSPMECGDWKLHIWDCDGELVYERWYYDTAAQAKQAARFWVNWRKRVRA